MTNTSYETKTELGHTWVRTGHTVQALDLYDGDLHDMQSFADDVNMTLLDNAGLQVVMQSNGWAVTPDGMRPAEVAALIGQAVEALEQEVPDTVQELQGLIAARYDFLVTSYDAQSDRLVISAGEGTPSTGLLGASDPTVATEEKLWATVRRYLSA